MAKAVKKSTRVTGTRRTKLAAELKRRYESGESIRELAAATGRSFGFVHRVLVEAGVNLRGRGGTTRTTNPRPAKTRSTRHTGAELRAALTGIEPPDDRFTEDIHAALTLLTAEENGPWADA